MSVSILFVACTTSGMGYLMVLFVYIACIVLFCKEFYNHGRCNCSPYYLGMCLTQLVRLVPRLLD